MGVCSPAVRLTDSLEAGKAFGETWTEVRFRGLVTMREEMVTRERKSVTRAAKGKSCRLQAASEEGAAGMAYGDSGL